MIRLHVIAVALAMGWTSRAGAHLSRRLIPKACDSMKGIFYLTGVPSDGSPAYPLAPAIVSRGVQTLSSSTEYTAQWTYNTTDNRIYIGNTTIGNAEQLDGDPLILGDSGDSTRPYGENGQISLVTEDDCATYLVMTGSGSVYGWWSAPTNDDSLPKPVAWYGDNGEANSAIRLDKLNVTRRGYVR